MNISRPHNIAASLLLLIVTMILSCRTFAAIDGQRLIHPALDNLNASPLVYFADDSQQYTAEEALERLRLLHNVEQAALPFENGLVDTTYWLAFSIDNHSNIDQIMHLITGAAYRPGLEISIYYADGGVRALLADNQNSSFTDRPLKYRLLSSDLFTLPAGHAATLLFKYRAIGSSYLPMQLVSPVDSLYVQHADSLESALFYSFSLSTLLLFALFGIVMSERSILAYSGLFGLGLLLIASMEGLAFQHIWPNMPGWNHYSSLVLIYLVCAAGLYVACSTLHSGTDKRIRNAMLMASVLNIVLAVASFMVSFVVMANLSNLMLIVMFAAQVYAISTWITIESTTPRLTLVMSVLLLLAVLLLVLLSVTQAMVPSTLFIHSTRAVYLVILLTTIATLTTHVRMLRYNHEKSLREAMHAAEREKEISQELFAAERRYNQARQLADNRRHQLASASHDMKQPLVSLRTTLDAISRDMDQNVRKQLADAFEYLDSLCRTHLGETRPDNPDDYEPGEVEPYPVGIVLQTAQRMFEKEAAANGISIRVVPCSQQIDIPSTRVMRIVSNLVANAIKHADCTRILIGARRNTTGLVIQVIDNGAGMSEQQQDKVFIAYERDAQSEGEGLGLAICKQIAEELGTTIRLDSSPGNGTCFSMNVPRASNI